MGRPLSPQALLVLEAFLKAPGHQEYGYSISQATGLKSGTLYPILIRLAEQNLVEASWETPEAGRPPRHLYRLTQAGARLAVSSRQPLRSRTGKRLSALRPARS